MVLGKPIVCLLYPASHQIRLYLTDPQHCLQNLSMVAESVSQGDLSQNGLLNGSKADSCVTVECPSHIKEYYSQNTLGCSEGVASHVWLPLTTTVAKLERIDMSCLLVIQRSGRRGLT